MTAALALVRLRPDLRLLARAAVARGWSADGDDLGYTLHAALAVLFGDAAPRPFVLRHRRDGAELLGYASADPASLRDSADLPPTGEASDLHAALAPATLAIAVMPGRFASGRRLGFELRARPIRRGRDGGRDGRVHEFDAYRHACRRAGTEGAGDEVSRESVYAAWLAEMLARNGAATVESVGLAAYRSAVVLRRPAMASGARRPVRLEGPDATFAGTLVVERTDAFASLLARGVGRHRAFGFGMLLLSPPRQSPPC